MPHFIYPFTHVGNLGKDSIYRPYVPVMVMCPNTGLAQGFMALVDTGADACLMPGGVTRILGNAINTGKSNPNGATGVGATKMPTWKHELIITLMSPDKRGPIWIGKTLEIDCAEQTNLSVLLGTIGFLENFKATFDYANKRLILEFEHPKPAKEEEKK
ncbi:MAG: hypothetical protein WDO14_20885 [Bacteroidota bacterium]